MSNKTDQIRASQLIIGSVLLGATAAIMLGPTPVALIGVVVFMVGASQAPLPALCLVVMSLPFYLQDRHIGHLAFSPTEILVVLSISGAGLRVVRGLTPLTPLSSGDGEGGTSVSPLHLRWRGAGGEATALRNWLGDPVVAGLAILFVLAGAASLTASVTLHESLRSFRTIIVEPAAFYLLAVTQVRSRRGACALALALVLAGVLISLVGFWQYATDQRIITAEDNLRRIRGFYGSPNNLGLFLGRALPMSVALCLWWKERRVLLFIASLVIALALLLTFSVGAWIAVAISLLAIAALRGRQALRAAAGTGVVVVVVAGVAALSIPRIGSHFNLSSGTSFERLLVWQSALRMLTGHPIRGIGLDNFLYYYEHGYRLPAAWREPDLSHPHNLVLDFWLSLGLPGLLLAGLLLGRFVEVIASAWRKSDTLERGLYAGVVGAMVDTVVHGMVDNSFFLVDLSVLFWLLFAIVAVLHRAASHDDRELA